MPPSRIPLGATYDGAGVHFAVVSRNATAVELCLFDGPEGRESRRIPVRRSGEDFWATYVRGIGPGTVYGYRVHGPYAPTRGHRFNPAKLLVDPRAKAICGQVDWNGPIFGYDPADPAADLSFDPRDDAAFVPKSVVVDRLFDWENDRAPRTPWHRTVVYECHVQGMTARHPDVPEPLRGTYLGMASRPILDYLRALGVTAVELLPVHHRVTELHLARKGLSNYWGYSTLGFFAPDARFATADGGQQVVEFKQMVRALHRAGLEVILDVVYNHSCEGDPTGPTLCMRGLDNSTWYRLRPGEPRLHEDFTGCGNTLDLRSPRVRAFVLDSLRYWASEMHVDGFRFDLAPALVPDGVPSVFEEMTQDPVIGKCKLIVEPWDLSGRGDFLGRFPAPFAEWNSRYRDAVRRFWRGDPGVAPELATRLAGSSDIYGPVGRAPRSSVNFVTCHDGFTLADLVSYEHKHNEANGEKNRDGSDHNASRNWGVEGPTGDPKVLAIRRKMQRNFLATLLLSQGVPMLSGGDEIGRTQKGNNNAYCQEGELTWHDWNLGRRHRDLLRFTREMVRLRCWNPVLRRRTFFAGDAGRKPGEKDLFWFRPDGEEMTAADWADPERRVLGMRLSGASSDETDADGRPVEAATLVVLLNGSASPARFALPRIDVNRRWACRVHSGDGEPPVYRNREVEIEAYSMAVFGPPEGPLT